MAKSSKGYFGLNWILSIILAIIPVTNIIFGIIIRATRGKILLAILNFFLCPLFYIVDLINIIVTRKISWLA